MSADNGKMIKGIIPPVLTAFDQHGRFDEKAQREIIAYLIDDVHGFYPCGTYGSGPLMSVEERKRVAEVIIDEVAGRLPVIIHVGGASTESVVALAKHAEEAGAYAVAAVPPIYYGFKESEVIRHFRELANAVSIPVFIYNNPKTTGVSVTPAMLNRLSEVGVVGIKDSSFDIMVFIGYLNNLKSTDFIKVIGTEALLFPAVAMGADAAISGLANAIPKPVVELYNTVKRGELKEAGAQQLKVSKMRDIMHYAPTLPMIQAVLRARGVNAGYPRLPFVLPDDKLVNKAVNEFKSMGVSF